MTEAAYEKSRRSGSLYGAFAYGSVIVTCFAGFLVDQRYYASESMVIVVFALGAAYSLFGILGATLVDACRQRSRVAYAVYFSLQCALLTGIIYLSPIRGFMGILVLPTVSQALFDLRPRSAALVILYLFAIDVFQWAYPFHWSHVLQAIGNYAAGFAFTIIFTLITKQAVEGRRREQGLRQEVEAANEQLREAARQSQELATTLERNRVAREIHDGVGHYLTVVKTQLDGAAALIPTEPERAREAVLKAAKLTAEALDDVRRSVGNLRADTARAPLADVLTKLSQEAGLPVTVRIEGQTRTLSPGIEHALFRSVQEGLTNVRKHATATQAEVALDFRALGRVLLAVTDNGRGAQNERSNGFGLRGIRERIELLGGQVEAGNQPDGGFRLKVEVPA